MKPVRTIVALLPCMGAVLLLGAPQQARADTAPGIPCPAQAKAVIANTGSSIHNSATLVDCYQSSKGAYGGANICANGDVQMGGTIIKNGGVIQGAVLQNAPAGFAIVPVPATGVTSLGYLNVDNTLTLAAGDYSAVGININSNGRLVITGAVRIWVSQWVNINGMANQQKPDGTSGIPKNLQILVTGTTSPNINSDGQFFGQIYAPLAPVNVNAKVFGSVVGSTVTLNSGGQVHFDQDSSCGLPDLTPVTITRDVDYYRVTYCNNGTGISASTFTVSITNTATNESFTSPLSYPFSVPAPGTCAATGGFTCGLIGDPTCSQCMSVRATVDSGNTVAESIETNNDFTTTFGCAPPSPP